jgi:hypothetical protein
MSDEGLVIALVLLISLLVVLGIVALVRRRKRYEDTHRDDELD